MLLNMLLSRGCISLFLNYLLCVPVTMVIGERALCTEGDYFDEGEDRCVTCPTQTMLPSNDANSIGDGCVASSRACPTDHFWLIDSSCSVCGGRCKRCDECGLGTNLYLDHEGRRCDAYRNRICCEYEHMVHAGDRCVEISTTTSTSEPKTQPFVNVTSVSLIEKETSRPETDQDEKWSLPSIGNLRNSARPVTHGWCLIGLAARSILFIFLNHL